MARRLLTGCAMVYIDMGTNRGTQIRKLYEPYLFPGNPIEPYFQKYFGNDRRNVCTFGFEPNPLHTKHLTALSRVYGRRGNRVVMNFSAVSVENGHAQFYTDPAAADAHEFGAGFYVDTIRDKEHLVPIQVPTIDIVEWFNTTIPDLSQVIVMKSDIEGHDEQTLDALFDSGLLCRVDMIYG